MLAFTLAAAPLLCLCLQQQAEAFSTLPTTPSRYTSSSTTARNAFSIPELSLPKNLFQSKDVRRAELKQQILSLASETKRGLTATDEQKEQMQTLFAELEALNPTPNPLIVNGKKASVNGDWSLDYTTSDSILGKGGFPRVGPIIQNIDTTTLSAKNSETVQYILFPVPRSVTAELSPVNGKFTDVKFKRFQLGPIGFDAPETFRGSLDITYLDEDVRLTRGDKGNIFVLTRM
jgi:hypothetical protein